MLATAPPHSHLRKRPIQARSRRTVESILEAADRVLCSDGYELASTNRIARVAGYSVGSLYQYFSDKESVVRTLIDQRLAREDELLAECLAKQAGQPLGGALASLIEFLLQGRWMDAHVYRTLASESGSLYGQAALRRILQTQSAFPDALQQLAIEHWDGLRRDDLVATLWVLTAASQAVTFEVIAHPLPDLTLANLVEPLSEAWCTALQWRGGEHPLVEDLAPSWGGADAAGSSANAAVHPLAASRRLAELRALLLRSTAQGEPTRLAPIAFALARLPALVALPASARPGVGDQALDRELRVFASALIETFRQPHG